MLPFVPFLQMRMMETVSLFLFWHLLPVIVLRHQLKLRQKMSSDALGLFFLFGFHLNQNYILIQVNPSLAPPPKAVFGIWMSIVGPDLCCQTSFSCGIPKESLRWQIQSTGVIIMDVKILYRLQDRIVGRGLNKDGSFLVVVRLGQFLKEWGKREIFSLSASLFMRRR